jgi:hypothetical protein
MWVLSGKAFELSQQSCRLISLGNYAAATDSSASP